MSLRLTVNTMWRLPSVALVVLAAATLLSACGGGGSSSSATPTSSAGSSSTASSGSGAADALLVIAPPDATRAVLADAITLAKVKKYFLTSLSMDPASFAGLTFAGDDVVWGAQPLQPDSTSDAFNSAYSDRFGDAPLGAPVWEAYDAVYVTALAAVAANSNAGADIKDNLAWVANSPGDIANYGGDNFGGAADVLGTEGGDVNYIGASGQVDIDVTGGMSKGSAQSWKLINGQISSIETFDVDLAAESGDEVPVGEVRRATAAPAGPLVIGIILTGDEIGTAVNNAAQMAVDEINAAGGVFGQDVVLTAQTISGSNSAGDAANSLISNVGADAIIGPVAADAVSPALDAAKAASIPLFALSGASELSALDSGGFLIQIKASIALQMPVLARLALTENEHTSVCVLYANGTEGETMAAAFKKSMDFKQATVRASEGFDPAAGDYKSLLESCIGS